MSKIHKLHVNTMNEIVEIVEDRALNTDENQMKKIGQNIQKSTKMHHEWSRSFRGSNISLA